MCDTTQNFFKIKTNPKYKSCHPPHTRDGMWCWRSDCSWYRLLLFPTIMCHKSSANSFFFFFFFWHPSPIPDLRSCHSAGQNGHFSLTTTQSKEFTSDHTRSFQWPDPTPWIPLFECLVGGGVLVVLFAVSYYLHWRWWSRTGVMTTQFQWFAKVSFQRNRAHRCQSWWLTCLLSPRWAPLFFSTSPSLCTPSPYDPPSRCLQRCWLMLLICWPKKLRKGGGGDTIGGFASSFRFPSHGMRCCRSDWPGLCLFCCYQSSCVVSQQSWFLAFLFHKFSNFTPPPPPQLQLFERPNSDTSSWHSVPFRRPSLQMQRRRN